MTGLSVQVCPDPQVLMVLRALQARPVWTALTVQLALKALKALKAR
jgi:hypothetical protein